MEEFRETMIETNDEEMWEEVTEADDSITDESSFRKDEITLFREGKTYELFKQKYMDEAAKHFAKKVKEEYDEELHYVYRQKDLKSLNLQKDNLEKKVIEKCNDSTYYFGQWNKNTKKREGRGVAIFTDGSVYEGFWKNDQKEGHGRIIYSSGDIYQGQWKNGLSHGYGIFKSSKGFQVKGWWKEGKLDGKGFEIMEDGTKYRGEYKSGKKGGEGVFSYRGGHVYEGEVKNNMKHGTGKFTYEDGKTCDDYQI